MDARAGEVAESAGRGPSRLEELVRAELLAARKSSEGLSASSMATFPSMRDLLGDGDPLIAFQRLHHRILETLDTNDDVRALEAAVYSLGLGSAGKTHLDRLSDFGEEYGFEARQVRRYSDRGIRQLAHLITSNWIVHTVPTLEVFLSQQTDGSFAIALRTTRQHFVDMQEVEVFEQTGSESRRRIPLAFEQLTDCAAPGDAHGEIARNVESVTTTLQRPFVMLAPERGIARHLRFVWQGEIWPRFVLNIVGSVGAGVVVTSQTLGNTMVVSLEAVA